MDHLYKIIWADDNIDTLLQDNQKRFSNAGIEIIPFSDAESAISYTIGNAAFVDGIITDAKYSKNGEAFQEEGKSFPGLSKFISEISGLRKETGQPLPCWIYTGYGDLLREKYDDDDLQGFEGIVDKKADYDATKAWLQSMCEKIAETKTPQFKLRQANPDLFSLCTDGYLGASLEKTLFDILSYDNDDETDPFNRFRDLLEEIMDLLVREEFIPKDTQKIAINDRIDKLNKAHRASLPQYVIPSLKLLLSSSALSHSNTKEKREVVEGRAPFMYDTLLMTLKTVLIWLKSFVDEGRKSREKNSVNKSESTTDIATGATEKKEQAIKQEEEIELTPDMLDPNLMGTVIGTLSVKYWSVKVGNNFLPINKQLVQKSWKPGLKLRVRTSKNYKGEEEVIEAVPADNQ